MLWIIINVLAAGGGFPADETITGYTARGSIYELVELDGEAVDENAWIRFSGRKSIEVRSPCFAYDGRQTLPMPWFTYQPVDRIAYSCIHLPFEDFFADALTQSTLAEVAGDIIILSDDAGPRMVFQRANH